MVNTIHKESKLQMIKSAVSSLIGSLGSSIFSFSLGLMLMEKTGLSVSFALSIMVSALVSLFFAPLVGPIVDKQSRKIVILLSQSIVIMALILYTIYTYLSNNHIFLVTIILIVVLRISDEFTSTAQESSKANIVLENDLQKLAGYQELSSNLSGLFSSVMGALLFAVFPFSVLIGIEILTELLTLILTWSIDFKFNKSDNMEFNDNVKFSNWKLFLEGLHYLKVQPYLMVAMIACMTINFFYAITFVGLPSFLLQTLQFNSLQYSVTQGATSLGFILGAYVLTRKKETDTPVYDLLRLSKILPLIFVGIALSALSSSNTVIMIWISMLMILNGLSNSLLNIPFSIWMQKNVPTNIQGRVFHLLGVLCTCIQPIGILIYVVLFDNKIGVPLVWDSFIFIISGIAMYLAVFLYSRFGKFDLKEAVIFEGENEELRRRSDS